MKITFYNYTYLNAISPSADDKIIFGEGDFLLGVVSGIALPNIDTQSQTAPYQDGSTYLDTKIQSRTISLKTTLLTGQGEVYTDRAKIYRALNPKLGKGTLVYENGTFTKSIDCVVSAITEDENNNSDTQRFMIEFFCDVPFWRDNTITEVIFDDSTIVNNSGNVETPVIITLSNGITNPIIQNITTGQLMQLTYVIANGERVEINTEFGNKSITHYDSGDNPTNILAYLSNLSIFIDLQAGNNEIGYTGTSVDGTFEAKVSFYNRYLGV